MENYTIVVALETSEERTELCASLRKGIADPVDLLSVSTYEEADRAIGAKGLVVVILDASFAEGTLMEDLLLFPRAPYILILDPADRRNMERIVVLGSGEFLVAQPDYAHFDIAPLVLRKLLKAIQFTDWQQKYLTLSEQMYRNLLQAIPDIVYTLDEDGYFSFVNDAVRELGYEPNELIGAHFSSILDAEDLPLVSRASILKDFIGKSTGGSDAPKLFDERRSGERKTRNLELKIKRKQRRSFDGDEMHVSLTAFGDVSSSGYYANIEDSKVFRGTVGIIRDITDKKRSESMIKKLFNAVDQSPVAVIVLKLSGEIEYANSYFLRHDGISPEEVLYRNVRDILLSDEQIPWDDIFSKIESGTSWLREMNIQRKGGISYWTRLLISPIFGPLGAVLNALIIAEDITQKKKLEFVVKQSLEEKERLLREMHHRVKNNLQMVSSSLHLQSQSAKDPEDMRLFQESEGLIKSMAYIHEQLYRSESSYKIAMDDYLLSIRNQLEVLYDTFGTGIEILLDIDTIELDIDLANLLGMIVNELVSNALKHAFPDGRSGSVKVSLKSEEDSTCLLCVQDDGVGIPESFTPENLDSLGITLVMGLVDQINGRIAYERNGGTKATISFRV